MSKRKIWIHVHIPKCGGTTFNNYLKNNFKEGYLNTNSILNDYQYSIQQIRRIIQLYPSCTCLTGHKLSLNLPYDEDEYAILSSTFIRNPVDRLVSHYFFHRNHTDFVPETKKMCLHDYIEWALKNQKLEMYLNGQVKFLTGDSTVKGLNKISKLVASGKLFILPLSKFDQSLTYLNKRFPKTFRSQLYTRTNVSQKDQTINPETLKMIDELCELDNVLYNESKLFLKNELLKYICNSTLENNMQNEKQINQVKCENKLRKKIVKMFRNFADNLERMSEKNT